MYGWSADRHRTTLHAPLADLMAGAGAGLQGLIQPGPSAPQQKVWLAGNESRSRRVCLYVASDIETGLTEGHDQTVVRQQQLMQKL
jgi:hypothetical protein